MAKPRKQKAGEQPSKPAGSSAAAGTVRHQKICLSVDMERRMIYGHTEMEIRFPESEVIGLNAVNMTIGSISVNGESADFEFFELSSQIEDGERRFSVSCCTTAADAACSTYISSLDKEMLPNLFISCRKTENSLNDQNNLANGAGKLQNTEDHNSIPNGHLDHDLHQNVKLVRINYQVDVNESCIHFESNLLCTENQIRRARCWFPCMDSSSQCSCYDLEFTVDSNLVAVSNGDLLYQVLSKDDPLRKTYIYKLDIPVSAGWISLAVAPFEILADSHNALLSYMSMAGDFSKLKNTVGFFHSAFSHYEDYLSTSFPFRSYKQVFVPPESSLSPANLGASMCIFGSDLLFDEKVIDETIETRIKLACALARQWFGVYIIAETPNDEWLVDGIAGFLTDSFIKRFLGNNEARYHRYKANCSVCKADVSGATALSSSAATKDLYGTHRLGLFGKVHLWKSVAILQMLEKQMGPESFRKILQIIIYRAQDLARPLRTLSTKEFRHLANKVGNLERPFLKEFFPRWVESCGCPILWMGFSYNKRRNMIEMGVVRDSTAPIGGSITADNPGAENREGGAGGWPGMMSIRVHELDGVYDHPSLSMTGENCQLLEIQCHSKLAAKRVQKPKKGTKPDGADENTDAVGSMDVRACMDSPLLWLRSDPEMEYLAEIHFHQPVQMWINQMEKDKDVVAQSQAIAMLDALPQHPFSVINALNNLLNDSKAFWRVRIEAAIALAQTASEDTDWTGLLHLVKFYKNRRFDREIWLPMPNDFHDVPEYFVQKSFHSIPLFAPGHPHAVALARTADGKSPRDAVEFILQLLKYNDNSGNPYSDVYWLASLVQSTSELEFGQQNIALLSPLLKHIDRLLLFDSLMPSHNNILTTSCIRALTQIALKMSSSVSPDRISSLMRSFRNNQKVHWKVRMEASKALLTLQFHWSGLGEALSLFLEFVAQEASLRGQVKLAAHAMRLCEVNPEPDGRKTVSVPTLVALLQLLESRKAYSNVYLRHHLFCMLQLVAGRRPSLYGAPRDRPQTLQEHLLGGVEEEGKHRMITAFLSLRMSKPQEAPVDKREAQGTPVEDKQQPQEPSPEKQRLEAHVLETRASSSEARPPSHVARDVTISIGSERKYPVVKIKVRQPTTSHKAGSTGQGVGHSLGGGRNEAELGPASSVSVDAPGRGLADEPASTSIQNLEEVNSIHDRGSRMTASVGSARLVSSDEAAKELQCTAISRISMMPEPRLSPETNPEDAEARAVEGGSSRVGYGERQGLRELAAERKKDDRKRKGEVGTDEKGRRDDPEYLEKKRLKKEKKRREKELAKAGAKEGRPPVEVESSLGKITGSEEQLLSSADVRNLEGTVEPKPSGPKSMQASIGTKVRIKLKRPSGSGL
ncbi:unnamed protein product [Spirodela intermedia]|uniref:Transcription initiation factor TFIID subunit 2 n=1 Tax=Spirodela intermedia TaxID=51605 RepID=A0A7I8J3M9_SPIIN|nr:unnamed protein product [Spirodela intermedia]CAA6664856.1 unnamed protein product [Spirodela intermedia]